MIDALNEGEAERCGKNILLASLKILNITNGFVWQ